MKETNAAKPLPAQETTLSEEDLKAISEELRKALLDKMAIRLLKEDLDALSAGDEVIRCLEILEEE